MPATSAKAIPTAASLSFPHIALRNAADVHEMFRRLGYDIAEPDPFEREELAQFEFDPTDAASVQRVYIVAKRDMHTVYLIEVDDLRTARLRGLAWNVLQRGTALLAVTKDYREIVFVDPRFAGSATKSSVRVNKLKLLVTDPTRHDLDTLNAIHAHRRTGSQIYDAQAEAFNVASVTRRFYDEYRVNYERVRTAAQQYNKGVREFQDADKADKLHAFAQRLLGRLMFIYFLQRKGWIGERTRFLTERYLGLIRHADDMSQPADAETFNFYTEVLTPLFFETFNKQRLGNVTQWPGILIPYLNGGLFDPSRDPDGPILLPDSLFDPHSSEGVLAFFNRYNFTVSEDTPLEQDVAVDPEMLGKVFENLLEERDRGQSGSFYTQPFAAGDDVRKWRTKFLEKWLIVTKAGVQIQLHPAVFAHLSQWQAELEKRWDKGNHWWELRACAYYDLFDTPKILYPEMGKEARFTLDCKGMFINNKAFMISSDDLYLLGVLNSTTVWEYLKRTCSVLGDPDNQGRLEMRTIYMETIPIPDAPPDLREKIVKLARQCLDTPDVGKRMALETRLNALVYTAYQLSTDEVRVIEGALGDKTNATDTIAESEISQ